MKAGYEEREIRETITNIAKEQYQLSLISTTTPVNPPISHGFFSSLKTLWLDPEKILEGKEIFQSTPGLYFGTWLLALPFLLTSMFLIDHYTEQLSSPFFYKLTFFIFGVLIVFVLLAVTQLIASLLLHILYKIFGGKASATDTIKAVYLSSTLILCALWIPILNIIAIAYGLYLQFAFLKKFHQLSLVKNFWIIITCLLLVSGISIISYVHGMAFLQWIHTFVLQIVSII